MIESGGLRYEVILVFFKCFSKLFFSVYKGTKAEIISKIKDMS